MKKRIMSAMLSIALLGGAFYNLADADIAFAESVGSAYGSGNDSFELPAEDDEPELIPYDLVDRSVFEEDDDEVFDIRGNNRMLRSEYDMNQSIWEQMMAYKFGENYFNPFYQPGTVEITDNTNQLRMTETDLFLKGKNGLDLAIRRKYESQDYSGFYATKHYEGSPTEVAQFLHIYRFNTSTGKSLDIGFYSEDEFYIYMYNGCYVSTLNFDSQFTSDSDLKLGVTYDRIKYKQSDSGIRLTYDSSVEMRIDYILKRQFYEVKNVDLNIARFSIGNGWKIDLPITNSICTYTNSYSDYKYREYSGVFVDVHGKVHTYTEYDDLREYGNGFDSKFSSAITPDIYNEIIYNRYYIEQTAEDGTVYDFTAYDPRDNLTYYMLYSTQPMTTRKQIAYVVKIADSYGNEIKYNYASEGELPVQITDTFGREFVIDTTGISYMENGIEKNITYEKTVLPPEQLDNGSLLSMKPVDRLTVTNQEGESTHYDSRSCNVFSAFSFGSGRLNLNRPMSVTSGSNESSRGYNLERIIYPTGMEKHYKYKDMYIQNDETITIRQMYFVESEHELSDGCVINKKNYTISGDIERTITSTREGDGYYQIKTYDNKGRLTTDYTKNSATASHFSGTEYWYDQNNNITREYIYTDSDENTYQYTYPEAL